MAFDIETKLKAMAIVNVFETSLPLGDPAAYAVLDDGAGVSYGSGQFTHRSGSLLAVVEEYLARGGVVGRAVFVKSLPLLRRRDSFAINETARDQKFKKALKAAAISREMRSAQAAVSARLYLGPAVDACAGLGLKLPLSLAVVYDSVVHGSWPAIRNSVKLPAPANGGDEKRWVTAYVRARHQWLCASPRLAKTSYRTQFFLDQIAAGRWELDLPLAVRGTRLTAALLFPASAETDSAAEPAAAPSDNAAGEIVPAAAEHPSEAPTRAGDVPPPRQNTQPPNDNDELPAPLEAIERDVASAARKYDRVEAIFKTVLTRRDAAKSLWTTLLGAIWQTVWAVAGFAYGIPRSIWLAAALIVGALAVLYLYRQIALAKIRERSH